VARNGLAPVLWTPSLTRDGLGNEVVHGSKEAA
jgi:hypothetical protein